MQISLNDLGYNKNLETFRSENELESFEVGRVISEHKDRYIVKTPITEYNAEMIGSLR